MSILHKLPSFYVTIICAASGSLPFGLGRETHHGDLRWQFDDDQFALRGGGNSSMRVNLRLATAGRVD